MGTTTDSKQGRINLRLEHNAKEALERAASFEGKSVSKFILSSALARAKKTITAHETMSLNSSDSRAFLNALIKPYRPNKKLAAAFDEHERRVTSK